MLARSLSLGLSQLADRRILGVLVKSLLVTLVITVALGLSIIWLGQRGLGWLRWGEDAATLAGIALVLGVIAGSWLLFRAIAIPVVNFFSDEIVLAVEARHYPQALASAQPMTLATGIRLGLASVGRLLLFNLIALPFYLFLIFTAVGPIILFFLINAVLLGRDLGDMVSVRHTDKAARKAWLTQTRTERFLLGLIVSGIFLLPFVNLLAPVLGAAAMTHLFHLKKPV
jgi:CysZ protein